METRRGFELTPLKSIDETLEQEFKKGEISGILLFTQLVDIRLGAIEPQIHELTEEIENARSNRTEQ